MCSKTPRFSYDGPKTVICTCPAGTRTPPAATSRGAVRGMGTGEYTGWVYRVGTGRGTIPGTTQLPREEGLRQRSGPVAPAGGGVGGLRAGRVTRRLDGPRYHPPGPVRPCWPSLYLGPRNAASWPIGRDSVTFTIKLVKNSKVSPKCL